MKMTKFRALFGLAACAAVMFTGCGKSDAAKQGAEARKAAAPKVYEPAVPANAEAALICDYRTVNKNPGFKQLVAGYAKLADLIPDEQAELKATFKTALDNAQKDEGGGWAVLACSLPAKFDPEAMPVAVPDIYLALSSSAKMDEKKLGDDAKKTLEEIVKAAGDDAEKIQKDVKVEDAEIAGSKAYRLALQGDSKQMLDTTTANLAPCWAVLDGQVLLAASNEKALSSLIALYGKGEGKSSAFSFKGKMMSLQVPKVGEIACRYGTASGFEGFPGGIEGVRKCSGLVFETGFASDGKTLDFDLALELGDAKVAGEARDQINGLLAMAKMGIGMKKASEMSEDDKLAKKVLDAFKVGGTTGIAATLSVETADILKALDSAAKDAMGKTK